MNNTKMRYYVGSLQGWVKEDRVQWEYGTYAFGRFATEEEAVGKGIGLIEYIIGHHTGFEEGTLERAIQDFKKDQRVFFYGGKCDRCGEESDKSIFTVLISEKLEAEI